MGASICSLILPNLYLGSRLVVRDSNLRAYGITASLSVCDVCPSQKSSVKVLQLKIEDNPQQKLLHLLEDGIRFVLENRLAGETVLVHCAAGVSRSATFVAAYLMTVLDWDVEETLLYMKHCRNCVNPNEGFYEQLMEFDKKIEGSSSEKVSC